MTLLLLLALCLNPAPAGENHEDMLLSQTRRLTFEGLRAGEGYYNADGSMMVFQSERRDDNPFYNLDSFLYN